MKTSVHTKIIAGLTSLLTTAPPSEVTLTFITLIPERIYQVQLIGVADDDLMVFDTNINESVQSGDDSTTLTFPNPSPGAPKQFFSGCGELDFHSGLNRLPS